MRPLRPASRTALVLALLTAGAARAQSTLDPAPLAALTEPAEAPAAGLRHLRALAVEPGEVVLDGRLDEAAWATAEVATGFVQRGPTPGAPATEPTEARVLVDGAVVYVGMRMYDAEAPAARLGRRDTQVPGDWASVMLGSHGDGRTAYAFFVNPAGVRLDVLLYDDVQGDTSWDAVWDAAVSRDSAGWTAEFRVPLSQLRYGASEGEQAWGLQFRRDLFRNGETSYWAPQLPEDDGVVSRFGALDGLRGLRSPRRLELRPYVASALTRAPGDAADPFYAATDVAPRVGLDATYGVTGDLTLAATVNPDFGQVEADPAQVNLGAFELFFPEQRPFFVEGADAFAFGRTRAMFRMSRPTYLYTRRIGRSPSLGAFVPEGAYQQAGEGGAVYADAPLQTTVLGAAKLSGRLGQFTVGAMNAVTGPEWGRYRVFDATGAEVASGDALVEPATNYAVASVRGRIGKTVLGALLTDVRRGGGDPALGALLPTGATVAGLDAERRLGADWVLSGALAGSHVVGSAGAIAGLQQAFPRLYQRPDAGHLGVDDARTSLSGLTGEGALTKSGGEHWLGSLVGAFTSPGFDANGLGFQSRADHAYVGGILVYNQNEAQGPFRNWRANGYSGSAWNFGGDRISTFGGLAANGELQSFWSGGLSVQGYARAVNDRLTRGGPVATWPMSVNVQGSLQSDGRRTVSFSAGGGLGRDELGGGSTGGEVGVEVRPRPNLSLSFTPGFSADAAPRQFVRQFDDAAAEATFGRRYVFARLDQQTAYLTARADWTFTPDLTLQLVVRPYVSAGRFSRFADLGAPGALRLPEYESVTTNADGSVTVAPGGGAAPFTLADPDFTARSLQGNAVLRWEYRPGSTLFVVWQQQRDGFEADGGLGGRDVGRLFSDPVRNVFLVKLSYWLG